MNSICLVGVKSSENTVRHIPDIARAFATASRVDVGIARHTPPCYVTMSRLNNVRRHFATTARSLQDAARRQRTHCTRPSTMKAWEIERYGSTSEMNLSTTTRIPTLRSPDDILIEVHAASVNPIDTRMLGGYGHVLFNKARQMNNCKQHTEWTSEFPLILGRDCSGVVRETGQNVAKSLLKPGDEVWAAIHLAKAGTHAEYTISSSSEVTKKPVSLSHTEAASIPYVAGTTWTALLSGCLTKNNARHKKVLILGGSGGIGTFAIQLLKAWGATVTVTCALDAADMALSLGADVAINYQVPNIMQELRGLSGFDFILDTVGKYCDDGCRGLLLPGGCFVTLLSPLMHNTDDLGLVLGMARSAATFSCHVTQGLASQGKHYRWAFFSPCRDGLEQVARLVDDGKIRPIIEKVFPFRELREAYKKVATPHSRGKVVVSLMDDPQN